MALRLPTGNPSSPLPRSHRYIECDGIGRRSSIARIILVLTLIGLSSCSKRTDLDLDVQAVQLHTLSGARISLAHQRAPVLVNFWSTSCAICLAEMPELERLYTDYADQGIDLVAVAMPFDPPNHVLEYAEKSELPFPVALDPSGDVLAAFEPVDGTPTRFLVLPGGQVALKQVGRIDSKAMRQHLDDWIEARS